MSAIKDADPTEPVGMTASKLNLLPEMQRLAEAGLSCREIGLAVGANAATGRRWYRVEIRDFKELKRPQSQGGLWYIAKWMRVIGPVENN